MSWKIQRTMFNYRCDILLNEHCLKLSKEAGGPVECCEADCPYRVDEKMVADPMGSE